MSKTAFLFGTITAAFAIFIGHIDLAIFFVLFAILYDIESIERRTDK